MDTRWFCMEGPDTDMETPIIAACVLLTRYKPSQGVTLAVCFTDCCCWVWLSGRRKPIRLSRLAWSGAGVSRGVAGRAALWSSGLVAQGAVGSPWYLGKPQPCQQLLGPGVIEHGLPDALGPLTFPSSPHQACLYQGGQGHGPSSSLLWPPPPVVKTASASH